MSAAVKDAVTPALLREVRDFWFEHLTNPKALIMPSFEDNKRWFFGGAALDEACRRAGEVEQRLAEDLGRVKDPEMAVLLRRVATFFPTFADALIGPHRVPAPARSSAA